jgi:hypothetical protein
VKLCQAAVRKGQRLTLALVDGPTEFGGEQQRVHKIAAGFLVSAYGLAVAVAVAVAALGRGSEAV